MYLDYRKRQKEAITEKNPLKYVMITAWLGPMVNNKLCSYEYNFSHLTQSEISKLLELNGLDKDIHIMGHELYKIQDKAYVKIGEIDPFKVLEDIQKIVYLRG
jgi:hypothetical protein